MRDNNKNIEYILVAILIVLSIFSVLALSYLYEQSKELEILIKAIGYNTGHIIDAISFEYD